MPYDAANTRYDAMQYRRIGRSGLKIPAISLGLWHNFGGVDTFENMRSMLRRAFDLGITHFDIANNYGPPPGSAEDNFGRLLKQDLMPYRDELIISTKAGYWMWNGPYGDWGSRKYLISSLDQSLKRIGVEYVDIFYHHRPDPDTPLEETMTALDYAVRSGRALYVGISNYPNEQARTAIRLLRQLGTPCLIHQPYYNLLGRSIENGLLQTLKDEGVGCIAFSPLAQGVLSDKYLTGEIPDGSRASKSHSFLRPEQVSLEKIKIARELNEIAHTRGQTLAQMALAWVLRHSDMTSALIGTSKVSQLDDSVAALNNLNFTTEEIVKIDAITL
jgi:L-glyceraldehyde 3-phosphate reductase